MQRKKYSLYKKIIFRKLCNFVIKIIEVSENNNFIFLGTRPNMILKYVCGINRFDIINCSHYYRISFYVKNYNINIYNFPIKIYTDKSEIKLYSLLVNGEIIIWNLRKKNSILVIKVIIYLLG